jgi:hypothetical protein
MPDVTVASTTDSVEEVREAAGLPAKEEEVEQVAAEGELEVEGHEAEEVEASGEQAEGEEAEGEDAAVEKPTIRPKTSVQKRIDKLTAKNYQLEEEKEASRRQVDDLTRRLEALERSGKAEVKAEDAAVTSGKPKPKVEDFKEYDDFVEALTDWKADQRDAVKAAEAQKENAKAAEARMKETFDSYNRAVSESRGVHEDFDEVVGRTDIEVPRSIQMEIINMAADGPEVAYQFASDDAALEKVLAAYNRGGDSAALVAFGRWLSTSFEEPEAKPAPVPVRRVAASKPAPIKPVGGSATKSNVPMDQLDYRDFRRLRDEQEASRHRR